MESVEFVDVRRIRYPPWAMASRGGVKALVVSAGNDVQAKPGQVAIENSGQLKPANPSAIGLSLLGSSPSNCASSNCRHDREGNYIRIVCSVMSKRKSHINNLVGTFPGLTRSKSG